MKHVRDFERVLGGFRKGEIDILVGTQMIAKGHDFPLVTLVGFSPRMRRFQCRTFEQQNEHSSCSRRLRAALAAAIVPER